MSGLRAVTEKTGPEALQKKGPLIMVWCHLLVIPALRRMAAGLGLSWAYRGYHKLWTGHRESWWLSDTR
ncbi:rCG60980 [Rattus norvegicus]|uniref:RCG60980 n=1 Tax=Rattus norvegicus TaxID=10116 RepID=A6JKP6_RAT|nr:rCG60980 [Rattus norvegicus]